MVISGKLLFLYGGQLSVEAGKSQGDPYFYCLDLNTYTWKRISDQIGPSPPARTQHCMELINSSQLVVFAGLRCDDLSVCLNDMFIFNIEDHTLTIPFITTTIPTPFYGAACAARKGAIIYCGGIGKEYCSIDVHKIVLSTGNKPMNMWDSTENHLKKKEEMKEYEQSFKKLSLLIFENDQLIDKLDKEKGELSHTKYSN